MKGKRDQVLAELRDMPNIEVATPTGAFYVLPEVEHYFSKKSKVSESGASAPSDW